MSGTNRFRIKYPSGATTEYASTAPDVDAFINEHFGSAWESAQEHGAEVELLPQEEIAALSVTLDEPVVHDTAGSVEGAGAEGSGT